MRKLVLLLLILPCAVGAQDELPSWYKNVLKQGDPDSLHAYVSIEGNCPFTTDEAINEIGKEFVRARLKYLSAGIGSAKVYLNVTIACIHVQLSDNNYVGYAAFTTVNFGSIKELVQLPILIDKPHIRWAMAPEDEPEYVMKIVNEAVADALTDYIRTNHDL